MIQLEKLSKQELGKLFPVFLVEPNPKWIEIFEEEKNVIESKLNKCCEFRIDHIGSTAISGIWAKPIIDILVQISENNKYAEFLKNILIETGYYFIPKPENPPPHMMFVKGYTPEGFNGQAFHIHIRNFGEHDEIYFRDFLNNNFEYAKDYEKLKIKLSQKYKFDRDGYTDAKTGFVKKIIKIAKN